MYGSQVPEPEAIHCTKWYSNPLARGSFHIMRNGCSPADLKNLSQQVRNLYFAGTSRSFPTANFKLIYVKFLFQVLYTLKAMARASSSTGSCTTRTSPARKKRVRYSKSSVLAKTKQYFQLSAES